MVGTTISRYEIVEKLGEGGMGTVYKARDLQLGRFVAIKTLNAGTAPNGERRARFVQEARAASSLNHPGIITIHEIVETEGAEYMVMEFVRGQTLHDLLASGRLPLVDALKIAMQIADALAAAHGIGIIHRDIKPANVIVTPEGLAKVLDFGLAKVEQARGAVWFEDGGDADATRSIAINGRPRTAEGAIIGTVSYMSPEQAEGGAVDARSDIFAFGSLMYEMLTGEKAFQGQSGLETLAAILRDQPKQLSAGMEGAGEIEQAEIEKIVARCLKKDADQRFQSMADVRSAIEQIYFASRSGILQLSSGVWKKPAAPKALPSIAVLPFLNISSDKENEYFSDGLAEEIIHALSKIENLRVTARTSAFAFRGAQQDVRQIGETLKVANVLEGSVRKAGNRIRVSVQLVDVSGGDQIWSERFDREMTDVFEIQDEISQAIVSKLRVRLSSSSSSASGIHARNLVRRSTENIEAYDLYLRGRYELFKMTREGLEKARGMFEEAVRLDPNYAQAHESLASCWYSEGFLGFTSPKEAMPKAKTAVRRALELDESLAEAHATLGVILALYDWDWAGAEQELARSIELNAASPVSRAMYAFYFLRPVGRLAEAVTELQNALSLDPLSVLFRVHLGFVYFLEHRFEFSIAQFRKALEMNPAYYLAHAMMGIVYTHTCHFDAALGCYAKAREADAASKFVASLEAMTLAAAGRRAEALATLRQIERQAERDYISPVSIAYIHTALGDRDAAFALLDTAIQDRDPNVLGLKSNPIFDSLRGDERYRALLKKMQLDANHGHA